MVLSVLLDDAAAQQVLIDAFPFRRPTTVHVSVSTISVERVHALARRHAEAGQPFVSAPVFGRPDAARRGALLVGCAGSEAAMAQARPVLEPLGTVVPMGEDPATANVVKMAGNLLMASAVQSLREATALVTAAKGSPDQFAETVVETLFPTSFYRRFAAHIAESGGAPMNPFANSARLSAETAEALGVSAPLAATLRRALKAPMT